MRASLKVDKDNSSLVLEDESSKLYAKLDVTKDSPGLALWDEKGEKGKIMWSAIEIEMAEITDKITLTGR